MKWSVKSGRVAGIDVYRHLTFLLLIGWVILMHLQRGQSMFAALVGVTFILFLFICVVLHEFGHVLTARRYGIPTRDIVLLPVGGLARLEKMPTQPAQELWVTLPVTRNGELVGLVTAENIGEFMRIQAAANN